MRHTRKRLRSIYNLLYESVGAPLSVDGGFYGSSIEVHPIELTNDEFNNITSLIAMPGTAEGQAFEEICLKYILTNLGETSVGALNGGELGFEEQTPFADLISNGPTPGTKTLISAKLTSVPADSVNSSDESNAIPTHKISTFHGNTMGALGKAYLTKYPNVEGV